MFTNRLPAASPRRQLALALGLLSLTVACGGSAGRSGGGADHGPSEHARATAATRRPKGTHPEDRAEARDLDALHYALELRLEPEAHTLAGSARITCVARRALSEARFDLVALTVTDARDAVGAALEHRREGDQVAVVLGRVHAPGEVFTVALDYSGAPDKGLYFRGAPVDHCFTQGECNDARAWFPCVDHPSDRATWELTVSLPPGWSAVSGGERVDARDEAGRRVEHWRMDVPHPPYLTTLVAGELSRLAEVRDGLGYEYLAPERALDGVSDVHGAHLAGSLDLTPRVIRFLEELTLRPYPYSKYATACVDDFPFGGMENASATTLSLTALRSAAVRRDADAEGLVVHEAAHQWFGDLLTCAEWPEIWLNEGFATYCALLWLEQRDGREAFDLAQRDTSECYLAGDERAPRALVHGVYREPFDLFFSGHAYQGGATRLHLLRDLLGEDTFRAGVRRYVGRFQHRAVTTVDLQRAFEEAAGVDLGAFFADWVHAPGHPVIEVSARHDVGRARVLVRVDQVQPLEGGAPAAFRAPITLSLSVGGEVAEHRLDVTERRHVFEVPAAAAPDWVVLDPRGVWPARIRHERGADELAAVLRAHPHGVARREAVRELTLRASAEPTEGERSTEAFSGESDSTVSREWLAQHGVPALRAALEADPLVGVRAAVASALRGRCGAPAALSAAARRGDEVTSVRQAAFDTLASEVVLGRVGAGSSKPAGDGGLWLSAADLAELAELAQGIVDDVRESALLRGSAARLVLAVNPEAGLDRVRATLLAARPTAEDPHGAHAAALVASLDVLVSGGNRETAGASAAAARARAAPTAVALAAAVALDELRPSPEREAAAAVLGRALDWSGPARAAVAELLGTGVVAVRRAAVGALATSESSEARRLLEEHYRRTRDPREQHTIEGALGL